MIKAVPTRLLVVALLAIGAAAYANSFQGVLIGDDAQAISENVSIRSLSTSLSPPADTTVAARPIANLTFAINYAIAGGTTDLSSYHAFNLAIHLLTAITLFGLIRRTLESPALRGRFGILSTPMAFAVAAIWVVHPLHTQAVTFLAQRVEALMGFFYVATLYCVVRAAEKNFRSRGWIIVAVLLCAFGMGTKETMIGAPILAALWIWLCWPQESLIGRPRTLLLGLAATMAIAIVLTAQGARGGSAGFGVGGWTSMVYLRTQAGVIVHYIQLAFWPHPLVFQYAWLPAESWSSVLPQTIFFALIKIATIVALIRRKPIALLGAWFGLILAPSSSIVPVATEVAAEHRMYLPLVAIVMAVVLGLYALWRSLRLPDRLAPTIASTVLVIVCIALGVTTFNRNRVYASAETLASDVVTNRPENAQARLTYGTFLVESKRFAEAEPHLRKALELPLPPSTSEATMRSLAHFNLGLALMSQGKLADAALELEQALAKRPDLDRAYPMLAEAQLSQGRADAAVRTIDRALERKPDDVSMLKRLAWILSTSSNGALRNGASAIRHADRAVALTGARDPVAFDVLAAAHAETGNFDAALGALAKAVEIVRANGPADLVPTLRSHLELFEAKKPVRSAGW